MRLPGKLLLLLCIVILSACQGTNRPDLNRLYGFDSNSQTAAHPVILIHGITGSKLRHRVTKKEEWYGNLSKLAFSNYAQIRLDIDPLTLQAKESELEAYSILDTVTGIRIYEDIIDTLSQYGGYQLTEVDQPLTGSYKRNLYVFVYDWRRDNIESVRQLHQYIQKIKQQHNNPDLKIDVVAHSMGGLILRYYLRYGALDVLGENDFVFDPEPSKNIRKAILLGTPNLGSVLSVYRFVHGLQFNLRSIPVEVLITMPSIYQMLPHSLNNWLVDNQGNPMTLDIFDADNWQKHRWAIYDPEIRERIIENADSPEKGAHQVAILENYFSQHLERARRFLWSLTVPLEAINHEFVVMGGDCELTAARLVFETLEDGRYQLSKKPSQVKNKVKGVDYDRIMLEPGDGLVTKASALSRVHLNPVLPRNPYSFFPLKYPIFLCADHGSLTSNINFQDNLLQTLLSPDL
ncbi:hypothetical protein [Marinicella sp. W31]|uniref:lipase/acyltransferase domain-containing protein n=1 Tax=Marinicella sp. W31 TaxID=3023713 RepID=UPI0037570D56